MMKNILLSAILSLATFTGINAQEWSKVLSNADGLPGFAMGDINYYGYYSFVSPWI